jgi:hypothetical protein
MAVLGGQNLMGVLQKDKLFDKLNTKGELEFQNLTLLQFWVFLFPHNTQNKKILESRIKH